jgi:two-component system sensor histidine kinase SenX3
VQDLLDLSRLETVPKRGSVVDVRKSLGVSVASHGPSANSKGLGLTVDYDAVSGQDLFVVMDATDLAVALDNLLDNAIAYTESGKVSVSVSEREGLVEIEISDTGIGIPVAEQDRVFERFYRVDPARTRATGGTGLGLSLVRHAAEGADGSVRLESDPGKGTRVTLSLPRAT